MVNSKKKKVVRIEDTISFKAYSFVKKNWFTLACMVSLLAIMGCSVAFAGGGAGGGGAADTMWSTIKDALKTWVVRLGGMVVFVGGIMFALGWKRDDADQKSQGVSTIVAGALVIVITEAITSFI